MESGNSSSMQSSSGADDDIDSKAESSMSMTMPTPMPLFLDHHPLSLPNYHNLNNNFLPSSLMFEPDYLPHGAYSSQPQPQPQQNPVPSTNLHLDTFCPSPSCTGQGCLPASSSLSPRQTVSFPRGMAQAQQHLLCSPSTVAANKPTKLAKNSRKRTRASRRVPTTVLTTDTSNFRAMVQEFTGFPAQPFSGSRKLDLFGSGSIFRNSHHGHDPLSQMFPLRPSAQKLNQRPLIPDSGNNTNSSANTNSIINNSLMTAITSTIARMGPTAHPDNDASALLLNIPKHPSGNHQNPITLPNSNTITGFPSLLRDHDPLDMPASSSLDHFASNSNPSIQDQPGSKWDGLQASTINMANTDNGHDNSRPLNYEDYGRGTQTDRMNHRDNSDGGLENKDVENWFWSV